VTAESAIRRTCAAAAGVLLGLAALQSPALAATPAPAAALAAAPAASSTAIETRYQAPGPNQVAALDAYDPASSGRFRVYYPTNAVLKSIPIVTWGNGTGATPPVYEPLLKNIASYGYAVVASYSTNTGTGKEIVAGIKYMTAVNNDPRSALRGRLDTSKVAAVGHSQGALGTVNADRTSGSGIKTIVPIGLQQAYVTFTGMTGSAFYYGGGNDTICPPQGQINAYNATNLPAALAIKKGAVHNTEPIISSVGGYLIAWLDFQLKGDAEAAKAFTGDSPEILHNPNYQSQAVKGLSTSQS
jgi:hypothetical protein